MNKGDGFLLHSVRQRNKQRHVLLSSHIVACILIVSVPRLLGSMPKISYVCAGKLNPYVQIAKSSICDNDLFFGHNSMVKIIR